MLAMKKLILILAVVGIRDDGMGAGDAQKTELCRFCVQWILG